MAPGIVKPEVPVLDPSLLLGARSFPHPVTHLEMRETALSWVLLTGPFAYKIKKPVKFGFIDASTPERRHELCREELRLNRRFAPQLYVDVVALVEARGRLHVAADGAQAAPVDYAVRMREFDPGQQLSVRLVQGQVDGAQLGAFGRELALHHQRAPCAAATGRYGSPALVGRQMLDNFATLRDVPGDTDAVQLDALEHWTRDTLARLEPRLEQRRLSGCIRECHGDLHAGNLVRWRGRWLAFDCLEFEPGLRWIDVVSDAAFLYMDLTASGRADLAHAFLSAYLEQGGDYEGLRLLRLYAVYRALVRAKVDALTLASAPADATAAIARRLQGRLQAAGELAGADQAGLVLMHGVTASGKSWVSERLIERLPALRVRSDLERRRIEPGAGAMRYSSAASARTYARLRECAAAALEGGWRLIVDATFLQHDRRAPFEALASQRQAPWLIASCSAPRALLESRLASRAQRAEDPSEATAAVLDAQLRSAGPLAAEERARAVTLDTASAEAERLGLEQISGALHAAPGAPRPTPPARAALPRQPG